MFFNTVWSVDLGKSSLKAVKLRREHNNVEILAVDKVDYPLTPSGPKAAVADPQDQIHAREALSVFRARNEVGKDPVIVSHPGQGTFSRFIQVPAFDAKKLGEMVQYEASQQIPFPLDEVIWDHHVIDRPYLSGEERDVGLFAIRREMVDDFLVDFTNEQLDVEMLTIGYLGTLNFVLFDLHPEEPAIILDIGATHTDLLFVDGKRFWIRPLPHSAGEITRAIMARFKLDYPEAEKLKIETARVPKQAVRIFQAVIQPKLQELVQEVHRSIGYYRSQTGEVKFTQVHLLGNGSKVIGIKKYLQDHLGMPVSRLDSIKRLRVNRSVNVKLLQTSLPGFATAIGCGIQAVGLGGCQVDLMPREEKIKKEFGRKKKHVFFAAAILLLFILAAHGLVSKKVDRADSVLEKASADSPTLKTREVTRLEKETQDVLFANMATIKAIAESRQGALMALRTLESVFADIPNAEVIQQTVETGPGGVADTQKAMDEANKQLREKLWMPYLSISLMDYPETKKASNSAREKIPTVPAYKVQAFLVLQAREDDVASNNVLQTKFKDVVEEHLKLGKLTVNHVVTIQPGNGDLQAIYYDPTGRGVSLKGDMLQVGQPFFGAEVDWYMVPRSPPPPAPAKETKKPTRK